MRGYKYVLHIYDENKNLIRSEEFKNKSEIAKKYDIDIYIVTKLMKNNVQEPLYSYGYYKKIFQTMEVKEVVKTFDL